MPTALESDGRVLSWTTGADELVLTYLEAGDGSLEPVPWPPLRAEHTLMACRVRRLTAALDDGPELPHVRLEMAHDTDVGPVGLRVLADHAGLQEPDVAHYHRFGHELREAVTWFRLVNRIPADHPLAGLRSGASPHSPYLLIGLLPVLAVGRAVTLGIGLPNGVLLAAAVLCFGVMIAFRNLPRRTLQHEGVAFGALLLGVVAMVAGTAWPP